MVCGEPDYLLLEDLKSRMLTIEKALRSSPSIPVARNDAEHRSTGKRSIQTGWPFLYPLDLGLHHFR